MTAERLSLPSGATLTRAILRCGAVTTYDGQQQGKLVRIHEFAPVDLVIRNQNREVISRSTGAVADLFHRGREAFARTGQALRTLNHRGLLTPQNVELANGTVYWVTASPAKVQTLRQLLHHRRFTSEELTQIAGQTMSLLDHLHRAGLMHIGLTADALLISPSGEVFLDRFGGWKLELGESIRALPCALPNALTPVEVLHPEAFESGAWTDVYGLAATLFEAAACRPPNDTAARLSDYDESKIAAPMPVSRKLSRITGRALTNGLALLPKDRPGSINDWRADWQIPERQPLAHDCHPDVKSKSQASLGSGVVQKFSATIANATAVITVILIAAVITVGVGSGLISGPELPAPLDSQNHPISTRHALQDVYSVELFRGGKRHLVQHALLALEAQLSNQNFRLEVQGDGNFSVLTGHFPNRAEARDHARALHDKLPSGYTANVILVR